MLTLCVIKKCHVANNLCKVHIYLHCSRVIHLRIHLYVFIDIEETDVESMSEGSDGDQAVLGDNSFYDFSFSTSESLPFTVHDASRTVTRKSHRVCYITKQILCCDTVDLLPTVNPYTIVSFVSNQYSSHLTVFLFRSLVWCLVTVLMFL